MWLEHPTFHENVLFPVTRPDLVVSHRILLSFIFSIVHLEYPLSSKASTEVFLKQVRKRRIIKMSQSRKSIEWQDPI
jgi:hypothetical protein